MMTSANELTAHQKQVALLGRLIEGARVQPGDYVTLTRVLRTAGLEFKLALACSRHVAAQLAEGDRRTVLTLCLNALNY